VAKSEEVELLGARFGTRAALARLACHERVGDVAQEG